MGIAHAMVWGTGQCPCMPRCMHRFWLHTSTMMHRPSAIVVRLRSRPASTPLLSLRLASDELHRLRLSGIVRRAGVCPRASRSARDLAKPMKFQIRILVDLFAGSQGSFILCMLGTHTGLSFESFTPTRVSSFYLQPTVSLHALVAQGQPLHYLGMSTFIPKDSMSFSARLAACCISLGISCPRSFCRFGLIASEHSA